MSKSLYLQNLKCYNVIMNEKVILILVDGMRPDAFTSCGNPYADKLLSESAYTLNAATVMPSVTLPVHFSLFHSVPPVRHGVTTNIYTPPVRPIDGLFEKLNAAGKKSAMFYSWGELRDVARPGSLSHSLFRNGYIYDDAGELLTDAAIKFINTDAPDFLFLYLGKTDGVGHDCGWMSEEQLSCVNNAISCIKRIIAAAEGYTVIVTADHGGHDRMHGTDMPEDMTIPVIVRGAGFKPGKFENKVTITDIAPTVAGLVGCDVAPEWEGSALFRK